MIEDVERMRELFAKAPADKAWRRRRYLVLCRARTNRLQQNQVPGASHADTGRRTRSRTRLERAGKVGGDSVADGSTGCGWAVVVTKVLRLQEGGIFRTIMEYL